MVSPTRTPAEDSPTGVPASPGGGAVGGAAVGGAAVGGAAVGPTSVRTLRNEAAHLSDELDAYLKKIQQLVRGAEPRTASGVQAMAIVAAFTEIERAAASGVALFAPVVVENGSFAKAGHGSAQDWLGSIAGMSATKAKGRLADATRAAADPQLTEALHAAELSPDQLGLMATMATEVPEATGELLELVEEGASHQELSDTAARLRAAKRSRETERIRRERVHAQRHVRTHQAETGGIRGEFFFDEIAWARVGPRLEREAKTRWKAAGSGGGESLAAHRADALIDLLSGSRSGPATKVETVVVIDAAALKRGTTEGDELCEIEGIGPVSVAAATELLTEGGLRYLVKEGFDIKTVTKSTRDIARCIEMALIVRDRTCARPGCAKRLGLERDHRRVDYSADGPTELDNLVRLCPDCHALKTFGGWRLEGAPGNWQWIAPKSPKSARYIAGARRLATAKAKATRPDPDP